MSTWTAICGRVAVGETVPPMGVVVECPVRVKRMTSVPLSEVDKLLQDLHSWSGDAEALVHEEELVQVHEDP